MSDSHQSPTHQNKRKVPGVVKQVSQSQFNEGTPSSAPPANQTSQIPNAQPSPTKKGLPSLSNLRHWIGGGNPTASSSERASVDESVLQEEAEQSRKARDDAKELKMKRVMDAQLVDMRTLREMCWFGVSDQLRPKAWQLILNYTPPNADRQIETIAAKRTEYRQCVPLYFNVPDHDKTPHQLGTLKQITVDAPRTTPDLPIIHTPRLQASLIRMLYIWAIRHPASGYVQGINDLAVPFLLVYLSPLMQAPITTSDVSTVECLSDDTLLDVEADAYWCVSHMLQGIQDHYTFAQPGIQRLVFKLKELVTRLDAPLVQHLTGQGIEFLHFSFRWMNCLLVRELPMRLVLRLWDTYLSDPEHLAVFHVYVCAAILIHWADRLKTLEFQELLTFLQNLPTNSWQASDMDVITAQAYQWLQMFESSPSHLCS